MSSISTVRSHGKTTSPVKEGVDSLSARLDPAKTARNTSHSAYHASAFAALAPHVRKSALRDALTTVKGMPSNDKRAHALGTLIPHIVAECYRPFQERAV